MNEIQEIWEILKEVGKRLDSVGERLDRLAKSQEETDKKLRELAESQKETDKMLKETRKLVESLAKRQEETDKKIKELAERQAETDEQIKKLSIQISKVSEEVRNTTKAVANLNGIWQDYTEDTIREGLKYALSKLGFKGFKVMSNVKVEKGDDNMEVDGIVLGDDYVIVLEVKTTLRVDDVDEFVEELEKRFLRFFPEYKGYKLYGAVAGMKFHQFADRYANKRGLIVLKHKDGKDVKVLNPKNFKPKDFSSV
ncbi:MAG: NERD domain-containing protein [candidate division WOR-3 bacterium]